LARKKAQLKKLFVPAWNER